MHAPNSSAKYVIKMRINLYQLVNLKGAFRASAHNSTLTTHRKVAEQTAKTVRTTIEQVIHA